MIKSPPKETHFKGFLTRLIVLILVGYSVLAFILWEYDIYNWHSTDVDAFTIIRLILFNVTQKLIKDN